MDAKMNTTNNYVSIQDIQDPIQDRLKNPQYVCSDWLQRVTHSLNLSRKAKPKQTLLSLKRKGNSFPGPSETKFTKHFVNMQIM